MFFQGVHSANILLLWMQIVQAPRPSRDPSNSRRGRHLGLPNTAVMLTSVAWAAVLLLISHGSFRRSWYQRVAVSQFVSFDEFIIKSLQEPPTEPAVDIVDCKGSMGTKKSNKWRGKYSIADILSGTLLTCKMKFERMPDPIHGYPEYSEVAFFHLFAPKHLLGVESTQIIQ